MVIALLLLAGLVALYFGAEWLVRGVASLAARLGVTTPLVGLTVVAYGTSTPELIVSSTAAAQGQGAIAIGNVVRSKISNTAIPAVFSGWEHPALRVACLPRGDRRVHGRERPPGTAPGQRDVRQELNDSVPKPTGSPWTDAGLVVAGLAMLVLGWRQFVTGAVDLARLFDISDAVIGLTIVAAGTSLPELASSLMAAWRKQPDIAIGNVVGSNIYNILAIPGDRGMIASPVNGQGVSLMDTLIMIGFSILLLVIAWSGFTLRRWEGALLLALYGGYLWHLWPTT